MLEVAKIPAWYGYPGNVTPQHKQNRILPSWRGVEPLGTVNLSGLRAGGYQGSLGYASAKRERDYDLAVLQMAGVNLRGFSGGLGDAAPSASASSSAAGAGSSGSAWDYVAPIGNMVANVIGAFTGNVPPTGSTTTPADASGSESSEASAAIQSLRDQIAAQEAARQAEAARSSQTTMYIAVGVGAVALLGLGYVLLRQKGK